MLPRLVTALAILAAIGCGGPADDPGQREVGDVGGIPTAVNTPIPIGRSPTPEPTPTPTPIPFDETWYPQQTAAANALIEAEDGVFGVVILDHQGNVLYSRNSQVPFVTASLYKLILLADILGRVETGEISLDLEIPLVPDLFSEGVAADTYFTESDVGGVTSVREMLYAVGAYSSNVSARALLSFTSVDELNETAERCGMTRTLLFTRLSDVPFWPPTAEGDSLPGDMAMAVRFIEDLASSDGEEVEVNLTTPMDMAQYQLGLVQGTTISPYVSEQILSILRQQQIVDRIPYLLPSRFDTANKPGNLIHVVNDVGVIFTPGPPRIVSALSEALIWDGRAHEVIQRLALIAIGEWEVPPITPDSMVEGGGVPVVFQPPIDSRLVIADPPTA